jgi:hypothetical protein
LGHHTVGLGTGNRADIRNQVAISDQVNFRSQTKEGIKITESVLKFDTCRYFLSYFIILETQIMKKSK